MKPSHYLRRARLLLSVPLLLASGRARAVDYNCNVATDNGAWISGQGSGTTGDLRYCIVQANQNPGSTVTIFGDNPVLANDLPPITVAMTVGASIFRTVSGGNTYRVFFVDAPNAAVTFQNLQLINARAKGGNGGASGGGGAGLGGAVFVNAGNVTLDNVSFSNVAATGGNGGNRDSSGTDYAGGGGGLGGNGGNIGGGGGGYRGNGGSGGGFSNGPITRYGGGGGGGLIGNGGAGSYDSQDIRGGGGGGLTNAFSSTAGTYGGAGAVDAFDSNGVGIASRYGGGGANIYSQSDGANGGDAGAYGGGGGIGNVNNSRGGNAGDFGGGGAGSYVTGNPQTVVGAGGAGGFGGGGGGVSYLSAGSTYRPGVGGFGGGNGAHAHNGGNGGSAFGGAVFVRAATGGTLTLRNSPVIAGTLTAGSGGTGNANGASGTTGGSGIFTYGAAVVGIVTDSDQTITGDIANDANGSLQMVKAGGFTLTLAGANSFIGGFTGQNGSVRLGSATGFGASSNDITLNQTSLDLNGFSPTIGPLTSNSASFVTNSAAATPAVLTVGGAAGGATADLEIRDGTSPVALVKAGPGQQTLAGLSSFTGGTTVSGGTLTLTGADNNGYGTIIGAVTVSPGAYLRPIVPNAFGYANGRKVNTVTVNGATLSNDSNNDQGWGVAYTLNGSNMLSNGGVNDPATPGKWAFGGPGPGVLPNATSSVTATGTGTSQIFGRIDLRGDNGNTSNTFTVNAGATLLIPAFITSTNGAPTLIKAGTGTLSLLAGNTYTGNTVVNAGLLELSANANGLGTIRGGLTINSGATVSGTVIDAMGYNPGQKLDGVVLNGNAVLRNDAQGSLGWGVAYTLNGGTLLSNNGSPSTTAASNLSFGGPAGQPTSVTVIAGTTPQIQGRVELRTDNNNLNSTFNVDTNGVLSVPAGVSGAGGIIKSGPGTMVLSGPNTYLGGTSLASGKLAVGSGSGLGSGGIAIASGAALDVSAFGSAGYALASGLTLTNNGTVQGILAVSGTYIGTGTLSGGLTVNSGVLIARSGAGAGLTVTGAVVNYGIMRFTSGATLNAGGVTSFTNNGVIDLIDAGSGTTLPATISNGPNGIVLTAAGLRVNNINRSGTSVTIQIDGWTAHTYQLQRADSPDRAGFANIGTPQAGTGTTAPVTLTFTDNSATGSQGFYRVVVN